jgi:hypothetical protein
MLENSFNKMMTNKSSDKTVTSNNVPTKQPQPLKPGKNKKNKEKDDASR